MGKILMKAKLFCKNILYESGLLKYVIYVKNVMLHSKQKEVKCSYGVNHPDKTFYVIKIQAKVTGILGIYLSVIQEIKYALNKNWIPVVDMKSGENQFTASGVSLDKNPWECFFKQIFPYDLDDVYQSKNVIISGWTKEKILHPSADVLSCTNIQEIFQAYSWGGKLN